MSAVSRLRLEIQLADLEYEIDVLAAEVRRQEALLSTIDRLLGSGHIGPDRIQLDRQTYDRIMEIL